jgi:CheY-like chemotaxis protein
VYTLLSGIADGLPEGRALLGVSTRNTEIDGHPVIHVEIRDGGGLATFAGVGGEMDSLLEAEQNQVTEDTSEWTALASRCNAHIRILRDSDAVTRAEVFLPLTLERADGTESTASHALWIVEDDDREVDHLLHMVRDLPLSCTRFRSASELKEKFSTAQTAPDMVLLKYYLPDERGAEVRSWLYEQDPDLPVILISSLNATHPGIATAHRLPATLYLQKPFTASDLLNMIHLNLDDTLSG